MMKVALAMLILCMFLYLNLEMATNTHLPESMSESSVVSSFTNYLESKGMWAGTLERDAIPDLLGAAGAAAGANAGATGVNSGIVARDSQSDQACVT